MNSTVAVGDEVFVRDDGRRATVTHIDKYSGLCILDDNTTLSRHGFIPVKWDGDKVGNTGIGVCAKNGSEVE